MQYKYHLPPDRSRNQGWRSVRHPQNVSYMPIASCIQSEPDVYKRQGVGCNFPTPSYTPSYTTYLFDNQIKIIAGVLAHRRHAAILQKAPEKVNGNAVV